MFLVNAIDVRQKFVRRKWALRQIDEMRAFIEVFSRQAGGSRQKTCVPSHDHTDQHPGKRPIIQIQSDECLRDKAGCGPKPRTMVVEQQIVVDRLWDMNGAEFVASFLSMSVDNLDRVGGIIPANIEEITDVMLAHDLEHPGAVFLIWLVACGEERG